MTDGDGVQRELGELSAHVAHLEKRLAEILAEAGKEHAELRATAGTALDLSRAVKALLDLHIERERTQRRIRGGLWAGFGGALTALAMKLWDLLHHAKPPPPGQ